MPLNVRRLRWWLAASGVVILAVVAGFLAYGRYRVRQIVRRIPQKLGANIQQTAQGFTYSQSEGGRTLFTIHASQMVQFRSGGRAELKDVNITVYGRNSSRFDQIYGSGFEYDPKEKIVRATGEVHIDLQADSEGVQHPDQQPPEELKNPIHVKTSGLEFNEKTGIAQTREAVEFRTPQGQGSAVGAQYDSRERTLTLNSDVHLRTQASLPSSASRKKSAADASRGPADIRATSAVLRSDARTATLKNVFARRGDDALNAQTVVVAFRNDSSVERVVAAGNVQGSDTGPNPSSFQARRLNLTFDANNELRNAELGGGASYRAQGTRPMHGSAGRIVATFGPDNTLQNVRAFDNVDLVQEPPATATASLRAAKASVTPGGDVQNVELKAPELNVLTRGGQALESAETSGRSEILLTQAVGPGKQAPSGDLTTISADRFRAEFDQQNHVRAIHGASDSPFTPAKIVSVSAGQPERTTTSQTLEAQFAAGSNVMTSIVQSGDFHYREGSRAAFAAEARFNAATNDLVLSGSPRYSDDQVQLASDSLTLNRASGEVHARGDVKTTYLPAGSGRGGAAEVFRATEALHVTSSDLVAQRMNGTATFTGGARLWQGANMVAAPSIRLERESRMVAARGQSGQPVRSVFVETSQQGRTTPVTVTAQNLIYSGPTNQAVFSGGVAVRGADATLTADHVTVFLKESSASTQLKSQNRNAAQQGGPAAAQIDRIIAEGNVTIVQPERRATGQKLVYVAANQSFTLTGGPPSIFDAERGTITGNSLTFYTQDDRVLIENPANGGATRTVIHTRATK